MSWTFSNLQWISSDMSAIVITFPIELPSNSMICIIFASTLRYKMILRGQCSQLGTWVPSVCPQRAALGGLSLFSLLLWASCTNALIMVWWLFVPTSSAGQTCHPFCFGQSWYWSVLSVASFSLLAGISVAVREKYSSPYLSGPHVLRPDKL